MTALDATAPGAHGSVPSVPPPPMPPRAPPPVPSPRPHFRGSEGAFFGLLIRGALRLLITLGIYRFWLSTDVRRFLWGNTEIAGDSLEYTGTPWELLLGFLMAIALMIPIYALLFLAALDLGWVGRFSGVIGFASLAVLGQFARYRARRYRLTRTVYRGIRFFQTGSAWIYAIRASLWWVLNVLTFGLAYPWSQASLERYKLRHTHFGDLDGRFEGSGTGLFLRGLLLWLIVVGPFAVGIFMGLANVDWMALAKALEEGEGTNLWPSIESGNPSLGVAAVLMASGLAWGVVAAALLYPVFQAIILRWWVDGVRLGALKAHSQLRNGQIYRVYLRFLGYSLLLSIATGGVAGAFAGGFAVVGDWFGKSTMREVAGVLLLVGGYVFSALAYSAVYQATVTIRFWRLSFETAELSGVEALDHVQARGEAASSLGEGLADALNVGGL